MSDELPKMPNLESGSFGFHHTVASALEVLAQIGIPPSRIRLHMAGRGYPSRWVIAQVPPPGSDLSPGVTVSLSIAGLGYFHALPVGMWDSGGERQPGTQEIMDVLDDPLKKAEHWIGEGARMFDLHPDDLDACSRWIALFGLKPGDWPSSTLYQLALILPSLHEIVATENGVCLVFNLLLNLAVSGIRYFPVMRQVPEIECSLLGSLFGQLGIDYVLGAGVEDLAGIGITVGPISLQEYYKFQSPENKRLVTSVLDLCVSLERRCWISWLVEDRRKAPRLGIEAENARLGVNSSLGRPEMIAA